MSDLFIPIFIIQRQHPEADVPGIFFCPVWRHILAHQLVLLKSPSYLVYSFSALALSSA